MEGMTGGEGLYEEYDDGGEIECSADVDDDDVQVVLVLLEAPSRMTYDAGG
jgi:hypothetical protein